MKQTPTRLRRPPQRQQKLRQKQPALWRVNGRSATLNRTPTWVQPTHLQSPRSPSRRSTILKEDRMVMTGPH
ncbi:unnamed protein product [Ectocarpus sp. 13 AM-2016]